MMGADESSSSPSGDAVGNAAAASCADAACLGVENECPEPSKTGDVECCDGSNGVDEEQRSYCNAGAEFASDAAATELSSEATTREQSPADDGERQVDVGQSGGETKMLAEGLAVEENSCITEKNSNDVSDELHEQGQSNDGDAGNTEAAASRPAGSASEDDGEGDELSSEEESSSDEDSIDEQAKEGLSEYELLRLRNIRRNRRRLAKLGLLAKSDERSGDPGSSGRRGREGGGFLSASAGGGDGGGDGGKKRGGGKGRQSAPLPRRSLPRRRTACRRFTFDGESNVATTKSSSSRKGGGSGGGGNGGNEGNQSKSSSIADERYYDSDESSAAASPVKVRRILHPQPHQAALDESHLKQYLRTRRKRRGRPRREEYEYKCDENCGECGGEWLFDAADLDVEEETRLVRCKDCRGAFHLRCMLVHGREEAKVGEEGGKEDCGSGEAGGEDERKPAAVDHSDAENDGDALFHGTRDPKRCYLCEQKKLRAREQQPLEPQEEGQQPSSTAASAPPSPSGSSSLLEASIGDRTVRVRVTPEPELVATLNGSDVKCCVRLSDRPAVCSEEGSGTKTRKRVKWSSPLEDDDGDDAVPMDAPTKRVQKLVAKALSDPEHARLQDYACAALRRYISCEESATTVVRRLRGVEMLAEAMRHHPDRPIIQAEAMCTLAEVVWYCPELGIETIRRGGGESCLDLALSAMEHHPLHSKVLQFGCHLFRALSYDGRCCAELKSRNAVSVVADSIRRNPRKRNVMIEGSMFLQNMAVVSQTPTVNAILRSNHRRSDHDADDRLPFLSTLLNAVQANTNDAELACAVFGLLANVALSARGRASLRSSDAGALSLSAARNHQHDVELLEVAFALLQNVVSVEGDDEEQQTSDVVNLILSSMEKFSEEEALQANACQVLAAVQSQSASIARLIRGDGGRRILSSASTNFPTSCKELVNGLLRDY